MLDFTEVKYKQRVGSTGQQVTEVWWKDCVQEQRAYTYFTQKLAESYENFQNKAKFMRPFIQKILERDYKQFMEADLVTWTNVLLHCEIFQSYQSIVTPNEASLVRTSRTKAMSDSCEGANFLLLQRRFVKIFLNSYSRAKNLISFPFTATTASV